jgi:hypothetical protein
MKYIKVKWVHDLPDEPVWLYSELNDDSWETRKVEIFRDGTAGFASQAEIAGTTRLSVEPLPPLGEIALDPQFEPVEIDPREFEDVWAKRFDRQRR